MGQTLMSVFVTKKSKPHWSSATSCTKHGISTSLAKTMKFGNVRNFSASGKKHQSQAVSTCNIYIYARLISNRCF